MAAWIWSIAVLAFLLAAIPVLIFSAHIPWLREITDAAPLEREVTDYERSLALGFTETADAYADRIASLTATAGQLGPARKEAA